MLFKSYKLQRVFVSCLLFFTICLIAFSLFWIHSYLKSYSNRQAENKTKVILHTIYDTMKLNYTLQKESPSRFKERIFLLQKNYLSHFNKDASRLIPYLKQKFAQQIFITNMRVLSANDSFSPCYKNIVLPFTEGKRLLYCFNKKAYIDSILALAIQETKMHIRGLHSSLSFEIISKDNNPFTMLANFYPLQALRFPAYRKALKTNTPLLYELGNKIQVLQALTIAPNATVVVYLMIPKQGKQMSLVHVATGFMIIYSICLAVLFFLILYAYTYIMQNDTQRRLVNLEAEKTKALSNMAAGIAHEIRNPINIISIIVQRLKWEHVPQEETNKQEFVELINTTSNEIQRISTLISDFLDLLRPFKLNKTAFSIPEFLTTQITRFKTLFIGTNINFSTNTHGVKKQEFFGDPQRLGQVLLNIIQNAIAASSNKQTINLQSYTRNNTWHIKIADEGAGIKNADLNHIFDMYFTTKKEGTGLGLYICRKIIQSHNGNIIFTHNNPQGIIVEITLPFLKEPVV